jgi:serine/threonine protein kinase
LIHREIKPQQLFRVGEAKPVWKILDFGVSKLLDGTGTLTGDAAIGTPAYMSPEQVAGAAVDPRADVFAFACVVYRVLTGRPAFSGASGLATMMRVTRLQPARPGELANVHPDVDRLFAVALAKTPARRIASAAAFATAWKSARRGKLAPDLRESAEQILAGHPWGTEKDPEDMTTVMSRRSSAPPPRRDQQP